MSMAKINEVIERTHVWDVKAADALAQAVGNVMDGSEHSAVLILRHNIETMPAMARTEDGFVAIKKIEARGNEAAASTDKPFLIGTMGALVALVAVVPAAFMSAVLVPAFAVGVAMTSLVGGIAVREYKLKHLQD